MPVTKNKNTEDDSIEKINKTLNDLTTRVNDLQNQNLASVADLPDPTKHKHISFAKSAVRIAAGISLIWPGSLILAGLFLIAAEVLGVVEEIV